MAAGVLWPERLPEAPPVAELLVIENVSVVDAETATLRPGVTGAIKSGRIRSVASAYGSIAEGKAADAVLLRKDPLIDVRNTRSIEAVVVGGRLYRRPDLDAALTHVETSVGSLTIGVKLLWGCLRG